MGKIDHIVPIMVCVVRLIVLITVGHHALQTGASVADEHWEGTEEEELSCYVSEVRTYRHSGDTADI
jgi:hypothetical protein